MKKPSLKLLIFSALMLFSYMSFAQGSEVTVIQDKAINQLLEFKKDLKTIDVFKIQIYSGSRFDAEKAKSEFKNKYGEWSVSMEYNTPNYKIWVGNFRERLEADRALAQIKRNYMNAFIFQPKKD